MLLKFHHVTRYYYYYYYYMMLCASIKLWVRSIYFIMVERRRKIFVYKYRHIFNHSEYMYVIMCSYYNIIVQIQRRLFAANIWLWFVSHSAVYIFYIFLINNVKWWLGMKRNAFRKWVASIDWKWCAF